MLNPELKSELTRHRAEIGEQVKAIYASGAIDGAAYFRRVIEDPDASKEEKADAARELLKAQNTYGKAIDKDIKNMVNAPAVQVVVEKSGMKGLADAIRDFRN